MDSHDITSNISGHRSVILVGKLRESLNSLDQVFRVRLEKESKTCTFVGRAAIGSHTGKIFYAYSVK